MAITVFGKLTVNSVVVNYVMVLPRGCSDALNGAVGRRAIIPCHGHGGLALNYIDASNQQFFADHARVLADAGYVVACIDNGTGSATTGNEFFDNDAMDRQNALINRLVTVLGCKPRVGFTGMSMGGGTALAFHILNPGKVSCIFALAPALDLKFLDSYPGYVPPYSVAGVNAADPNWATELTADYPSGFTSHDPLQNIAAFRNTVPIKIAHATDDTLLSFAGSQYFVNQVNDPKVTMRTPNVTGGHSVTFVRNLPTKETVDFFNNNWVD